MSALVRFLIVAAGAAAVALMGVLLGAWWAPFATGVAAGAFVPRARWAVLAGAVAGLVSWVIPLEYAQLQFGLGRTALSLAAIMGFTDAATVPVALTLLVGTLLGFSGAWLGSAARSFYPVRRPSPPAGVAPQKQKSGRPLDAAARRS